MAKTLMGETASALVWECLKRIADPETGAPLGMRWLRLHDSLRVIESWTERDGEEWLHVSFSYATRVPEWHVIKEVKQQFFGANAEAYVILPVESHYVNDHPYVLHLFGLRCDVNILPDFRTQLPGGRYTL